MGGCTCYSNPPPLPQPEWKSKLKKERISLEKTQSHSHTWAAVDVVHPPPSTLEKRILYIYIYNIFVHTLIINQPNPKPNNKTNHRSLSVPHMI